MLRACQPAQSPLLPPLASKIALRSWPKANSTPISVLPVDPGRSSSMVAWRLAFDSVGQRPPGRRALITQDPDRRHQRPAGPLFVIASPLPALGAAPRLPPAPPPRPNGSAIHPLARNT